MRALYDLGHFLPSFNYFEWMLQAHARGASVVVFDIRNIRAKKWDMEKSLQRFWSICEPGPALIGLPREVFDASTISPTGALPVAKTGGGPLVAFWRAGHRFKRLRSVKPAGSERYTVTLRRTERSPLRDSDEAVWREFAREIGARVIPDYDTERIHLHDRMALYAGAEMNFFVSNGPGVLCSFTEYPCMMFNTHHAYGSLKLDGMVWGEQYPWMLEGQRAIWEEATPESLRKHFYRWREDGTYYNPPDAPTTAA